MVKALAKRVAIKPYARNAKKHPKKQIEQIAASIKGVAAVKPLLKPTA